MLNKIILTNQLNNKFTIFAARKGGMDMFYMERNFFAIVTSLEC